jgi:endonuclease/exonuclease/phosphatase family metal-dependent hydrolase
MTLRIGTFNVENLMHRFDFSGYRNELYRDRALALYMIEDEAQYRRLEAARTVALADDARQLSALAIAEAQADILCLQEVENMETLKAFEFGYLFKMIGHGYRGKYVSSGNDSRGIDVAVIMRESTRDGEPIEFVGIKSHAYLTFGDLDLLSPELQAQGVLPQERVFRRDCLEIDIRVGGTPMTVYCVHFKSMGNARNGVPGRLATMPLRRAEARAVRHIIAERFDAENTAGRNWAICGDLNDYERRIVVKGDARNGWQFEPVEEESSALDILLADGFCENVVNRLPLLERWTLYHTRGPDERHLCQLDYLLLSPRLARHNKQVRPEIIRKGQPWRTPMPPEQEMERYPRTGWDRPKASDHCPVVIELALP